MTFAVSICLEASLKYSFQDKYVKGRAEKKIA